MAAVTAPTEHLIVAQFIVHAKTVGVTVVWIAVAAFHRVQRRWPDRRPACVARPKRLSPVSVVLYYRTNVNPPSTTNICPVA
jgi:hypothetical protein